MQNDLLKLRCKKHFGVWFYRVERPTSQNSLDGQIYELYNEYCEHVADFAYYGDMKIFVETGVII